MAQGVSGSGGVTVFGSALLRVAPDTVSVTLTVSRQQRRPEAAFKEAREGAQAVRQFLTRAGADDVRASRITLSEARKYVNGDWRRDGYDAKVSFNVVLRDLDRLEAVISGAVDAGANELGEVTFSTTRLRELRAEARRRAVQAARAKAEVYAEAAGVSLGPVLNIEDQNPEQLRGRESHVTQEPQADDEGPAGAFDPGSIIVGAAVRVTFKIEQP